MPLDAYYTAPADARICLEAWLDDLERVRGHLLSAAPGRGSPYPRRLLEPGVGGGVWIEAYRDLLAEAAAPCAPIDTTWWAVDQDPTARGLGMVDPHRARVGDFLELDVVPLLYPPRFDAVVGNPPYLAAEAFVRKALGLADHVVFLLRAGFEQAACRVDLLRAHPPTRVYRLTWRPAFVQPDGSPCGKTGNPHDYALFWWGPPSLGQIPPAYLTRGDR